MRFSYFRAALGGLIALACVAATAQPAPYAPSPRVGDEIDRAERDYFGLFPEHAGFESARFTEEGDSVRVTIRHATPDGAPAETQWRVSRARAQALGAYVEAFEGLELPTAFAQWQLMRGTTRAVAASATVPTAGLGGRRPDVQVLAGRQRYDGALLAASDTLLLLHPVGRPYDWRAPAVLALDPAEIDWVTMVPRGVREQRMLLRIAVIMGTVAVALPLAIDQQFGVRSGGEAAFIGGIVAGYVGGSVIADRLNLSNAVSEGPYAAQLPALRTQARFRFPSDLTPAEAAARGRRSGAITPVVVQRRGSVAWQLGEWRRRYGWVSLTLLGPGRLTGGAPPPPSFQETFVNAPAPFTRTPRYTTLTPSVGVDLALRPVPWARGGVAWQHYAIETPPERSGATANLTLPDEIVHMNPGGFRGYAEAVLPMPRPGGFGVDLALGGGLERNDAAVTRGGRIGARDMAYRYESGGPNRFVQASVELTTPRRASFLLRLTHRALPTVEVPAEYIGTPGFPPLYTREAHTIDFGSRTELLFGTRFRY